MRQQLPLFSIVIPTYRRPGNLADCLRSLTRCDYPRNRFEVIVVDDGSGAPPEAMVAEFRNQLEIRLLVQPHAGPATARNTGAAQAKGEFLAFIDDDCAPATGWLRAVAARLATSPDHAVGGRTINALPENLSSTASQLLIDHLYSYYNADHNRARFFTSNNLAVPADSFHRVGGFDTAFPLAAGEDREFCDHWRHHGHPLTYAPEAVVYHSHALTLRTFLRQHFNYGRGAFYFHQARARRSQGRMKIEPLPFYLRLLGRPFSHAWGWRAPWLAALCVASQGANAAGFCWEQGKQLINRTAEDKRGGSSRSAELARRASGELAASALRPANDGEMASDRFEVDDQ